MNNEQELIAEIKSDEARELMIDDMKSEREGEEE